MEPKDADLKLYILRNMEIAGVFLAKKNDQGDAEILLDYAVPRYRDFQLGRYLFEDNKAVFARMGVKRLIASSSSDSHTKYLKKMGFEVSGDKFVKQL
jgi:N-acetylglutamate synthase-like GNAT family acetyltransferase